MVARRVNGGALRTARCRRGAANSAPLRTTLGTTDVELVIRQIRVIVASSDDTI